MNEYTKRDGRFGMSIMFGNRKYLPTSAYRIASALAYTTAVELESREALILPVPFGAFQSGISE